VAQEHSVYTWDPVTARWIHERGPEVAAPPVPPDVHAIQTYFFDLDDNEWIATVLAPRGRALAAQWQGAHKIPDNVAASPARPAATARQAKTNPSPLFAVILVVLIVGGGAAVVAGTQRTPNAHPAAPTAATGVGANPSTAAPGDPAASGATPGATQPSDGAAAPTRAPVPPAATVAPLPGSTVTLSDGSVVAYSGPARMDIGVPFAVTFIVRNSDNTPGVGTLLMSFGDATTGGSSASSGTLDPNGVLVVHMPGTPRPGNFPIVVNYKGHQGQVAILRVG
jgi:hypothetical protein